MSKDSFVTWNGKDLRTIGDIMNVMKEICQTNDKDLANKFMAEVIKFNPLHGKYNIGYLTGYFGHAEADKMRELFDVSHPIFGRKNPTVEEAYAMGEKIGRQMKNTEDDA